MSERMTVLLDENRFENALSVTKIWCALNFDKTNLSGSLRPLSLMPTIDIRSPNVGDKSKAEEVDRLNSIKANSIAVDASDVGTHGRILVFYPELSLGDGFVGMESQGFIDEDERPPWGTWFYFLSQSNNDDGPALFSWVPEEVVAIIDRALKADQYDCLRWYEV